MVYTGEWNRDEVDYKALAGQWHVLCRSEDVGAQQPLAAKLLGEDLVLWRDEAGQVHAWKDYCGHRGARLSLGCVKQGEIECPYHGWRYNAQGQCTRVPAHPERSGPASHRLVYRHHAQERYGYVWVSLEAPQRPLPELPQWEDDSYRKVYAGPYHYKANALRSLENFIDASHFPFVHAHLNGLPDAPEPLKKYSVHEDERGLHSSEITVFQPFGDHRGIPVNARYTYSVLNPTTAYFMKKTGETERFCTFFNATPVDEAECIIWLIVAINFGPELTLEQILARQNTVFEQDRRIVESQRPARLPLDPRAEMHVVSDRMGLEYRRWIQTLGQRAIHQKQDSTIATVSL
ncbi:MAG: aromatic ring-hydroxylating dioxygenase subunit alpha [Pseudomonas sp.]|uniref:aromatic ring-hydroxylating dioxygenase subunit alpha n=1 Tax=Pseudomonas entomophila TaxID=312306 RepID=UPI0015E45933|nr:aromatic ring-hydroxylating dioxygenase subunit alpha [Pseudomonas entomophila]MBA1194429.1 aromatic ring-hydroxylating dioxygenase subunit alpha [Pseudomonas entomophila]MDF2489934.1 aromatic ring-hydroxylating dioxygenase subunit alpha [Pseudomonas sp.]